jgi:hypothetical protein
LHAAATAVAYYLHAPREPLFDLGFELLPQPSPLTDVLCSALHYAILVFTTGFLLAFLLRRALYLYPSSPSPRVTLTAVLARVAASSVLVQALRIVSFLATTLPGPNDTCRPQSPLYAPPQTLNEVLASVAAHSPLSWPGVAGSGPLTGCGDSVFAAQAVVYVQCALIVSRFWHLYRRPQYSLLPAADAAAPTGDAGAGDDDGDDGCDDDGGASDDDMEFGSGGVDGSGTRSSRAPGGSDDDAAADGSAPDTAAGARRRRDLSLQASGFGGGAARGERTSCSSSPLAGAVPMLMWAAAAAASALLVVRRMHYTLDVVLAWTTTPLVWVVFDEYVHFAS